MKLGKSLAVATLAATLTTGTALAATPLINEIDQMNLTPLSDVEAAEVRGEGWFKIGIKIVDNIGRVLTTYEVWKFFWYTPNYSTCVYSYTANSTPMYCY